MEAAAYVVSLYEIEELIEKKQYAHCERFIYKHSVWLVDNARVFYKRGDVAWANVNLVQAAIALNELE